MPLNGARPVSGRYSGAQDRFAVELRVDVDGARPTRRVSADYFRDGRYYGSMRVDAPQIAFDANAVKIAGKARFSWRASAAAVRVTIPRAAAHAPAKLSHLTANGSVLSTVVCEFDAPSFRRVDLQETCQHGITPFSSYDTASLPCAGPPRELTLESAFAEAGIEFVSDEPPNVIDAPIEGPDGTWSDAELQAAMQRYFSRLDERPQWAIWLLHARAHDNPHLYGLMFDRTGLHRQGCAVFYGPMSGTDAKARRDQLYTCVHELGHGFNLMHSWQKSRARPPVPSRPRACSWMNAANRFPGGPTRFWSHFAFEFDEPELVHLRHAFQEDVIMGGSPFEGGAASFGDYEPASPALRMRISAPATFGVGVPVTVAIDVATTGAQSVPVARYIGPRSGNVDVAIRGPGGEVAAFVPLLTHCHGDDATMLSAGDRPRRDYAFLHYGKGGFAFARPGRYEIRARHTAMDGTVVVSNVLSIEVAAPRTREERAVSLLVTGNDDVGALLSITGSAAPIFDGANRTLDKVIERYPSTDAALIARVARSTSLARPFKLLAPGETRVQVRAADPERAAALIDPVIDLAAVYRAMPPAGSGTRPQRAAAGLARVGTRPSVPAAVTNFVNTRRMEIATAIASPQMAEHAVEVEPPRQRPRAPVSGGGSEPPGGYG